MLIESELSCPWKADKNVLCFSTHMSAKDGWSGITASLLLAKQKQPNKEQRLFTEVLR